MDERYTVLRAKITEADDAGTITGVAMVYGTPIQRGPGLYEQVEAGAFRAQMNAANRVAVLWQHDWESPIGRALDLFDKDGALHFKARISEHADIPEARKALALLREGYVDEVSVGFEWGTWKEQRNEAERSLTIVHEKSRLRELSVVTFGALGRDARVLSVASASQRVNVAAYRERLARLQA